MSQLWQQEKKLDRLNIKVVVITFEPPNSVDFPAAEGAVGFPYLVDDTRELYEYYGFLSAGFWDIWGPRTWLRYLSLLMKGRKMIKSQGDIEQRGGDVLIDPQGIVRYHNIGSGPGDRPNPAILYQLVENS